jgi:hypothetical protein
MNAGRLVRSGLDHATPWPGTTTVTAPSLVACPMVLAPGLIAAPAAVQELYRLAYERARAAARPSRYELARLTLWN